MWLHKEKRFEETRLRLADEGFAVKECTIANETCFLIFPPNMGVEWNEDNMIYRSGIWNYAGQPVSLSWKKFFNWDEKCELAPKPTSLDDCTLMNKEDGSTLLVSMYKGELVMRTRGASTMDILDNGDEKEFLINKYPTFFNFIKSFETTSFTYVFEWETPSNKIVLDYGDEPRLVFTGQICHDTYKYVRNDTLDTSAVRLDLVRPPRYGFSSFESMKEAMTELRGIEGICVYFNEDQDIKKMKTIEYLMLHSIKFRLGYKALIDMIYEENQREEEFKAYIEKRFDHEGLTFVKKLIEDIYMADYTLKSAIDHDYSMIILSQKPQDKKEFAACVFNGNERYKIHSAFLFKMYESDNINICELLMTQLGLRDKFKKMILEMVTS